MKRMKIIAGILAASVAVSIAGCSKFQSDSGNDDSAEVIFDPGKTKSKKRHKKSRATEEEVAVAEPVRAMPDTVRRDSVVVEEVAPAPAVPAPAPKVQKAPKAPAEKAPKKSSPRLDYGNWTGAMKNGQPHGTGTMTYTTYHQIDSRDPKGRVAERGEYIIGEWDNGHLVQGRWYKSDGTTETIIIGRAG